MKEKKGDCAAVCEKGGFAKYKEEATSGFANNIKVLQCSVVTVVEEEV